MSVSGVSSNVSGAATAEKPTTPARKPAVPSSREPAAAAPDQRQQLLAAVEQLNRQLRPVASNLMFSIDEATGTQVVRIVDSETSELIRQVPTEETLAIVRGLDRAAGLLLKRKA